MNTLGLPDVHWAGGTASVGPPTSDRFLVRSTDCAHRAAVICLLQMEELVVHLALSREGGGFIKVANRYEPVRRKSSLAQVFSAVYLQARGEVAEWLKAAVC